LHSLNKSQFIRENKDFIKWIAITIANS